jgi:hypothetical protein
MLEEKTVSSEKQQQLVAQVIDDLLFDIIDNVLTQLREAPSQIEANSIEIVSSESGMTSPVTVIPFDDRSESSQSTTTQPSNHSVELVQTDPDTVTSELTNVTWNELSDDGSSHPQVESTVEYPAPVEIDVVNGRTSPNSNTVEVAAQANPLVVSVRI